MYIPMDSRAWGEDPDDWRYVWPYGMAERLASQLIQRKSEQDTSDTDSQK